MEEGNCTGQEENNMISTVYMIGAGMTKAIYPDAPLTNDLLEVALDRGNFPMSQMKSIK